jgi:hypothetical protein
MPDTAGPIVHAANSAMDQLVHQCTIEKKGDQRSPGTWRSCAGYKKKAIAAPSAIPNTAAMAQSINAWIS